MHCEWLTLDVIHSWWCKCIISLAIASCHLYFANGCAICFDTHIACLYSIEERLFRCLSRAIELLQLGVVCDIWTRFLLKSREEKGQHWSWLQLQNILHGHEIIWIFGPGFFQAVDILFIADAFLQKCKVVGADSSDKVSGVTMVTSLKIRLIRVTKLFDFFLHYHSVRIPSSKLELLRFYGFWWHGPCGSALRLRRLFLFNLNYLLLSIIDHLLFTSRGRLYSVDLSLSDGTGTLLANFCLEILLILWLNLLFALRSFFLLRFLFWLRFLRCFCLCLSDALLWNDNLPCFLFWLFLIWVRWFRILLRGFIVLDTLSDSVH